MKVNVRATIQSIGSVNEAASGAKWLTFRAKTVEDYSQLIEVKIFKKKEYAEHADNFVKYNQVGDLVDMELSIQCSAHEPSDRIFTNLNLWNIKKVTEEPAANPPPPVSDSLPF